MSDERFNPKSPDTGGIVTREIEGRKIAVNRAKAKRPDETKGTQHERFVIITGEPMPQNPDGTPVFDHDCP
jgi:hypothetical protein